MRAGAMLLSGNSVGTLARRLCVSAALVLAGASAGSSQALPDTLDVAVLESWSPHYLTDADGEPAGFAVDMMEAVSDRIGIPVRYRVYATFAQAADALRSGAVDVIPDYGILPSRSGEVAFTRSFEAFRVGLFIRATDSSIRGGDDLAERTVGTVHSNVGDEIIRERYPDARVVMFESPPEALFGLLAGSVDAVAYPEEVMLALAAAADVGQRIRIVPPPLAEVRRGMAVAQGDTLLLTALDGAVADLLTAPEYPAMYRRWFADPRPFWTVTRVLWIAGTTLVLVLLGMGVWRYISVAQLARQLTRTLAERDAARERGRRDEARFRTLVDTAYEGIVVGDEKNSIVFANRRICEILGVSMDQITGRSLFDFVDEEYHDRLRAGVARRRRGISDSYEVEFLRADGSAVPILLSAAPLMGQDGSFEGSVATAADITDRARAEQSLRERERRYRAFVENSSELISTLDAEGVMAYQSPPVERMLGFRQEELAGRSTFEYIHPEDEASVREVWTRMLERPGEPMQTGPFRFRHRDGSWRILTATITNLLDDPAVGAILSNAEDITVRSELERQLLQAQKLEAIGRLAGGIAHDFNNLLTVIRVQTDLLLLELPPAHPLAGEVELVQGAADRAATLTSQLLAFSREQVLRPRRTDLGEVVCDATRLLARIIGEDVSIRLETAAELPPVFLDPNQLEQAIMNLGVNARDAMPAGGTLTLTTRVEMPGKPGEAKTEDIGDKSGRVDRMVILEVTDTGMGMAPDTVSRVFEPFFTTKERGRGTGLGLSMVYGFVRQSGGLIEVESTLGVGTTFRLRFRAETGTSEPRDKPARPTTLRAAQGSQTILVVEDEEAVRRVERKILERAGYSVHEAGDVDGALDVLDTVQGIDLVLSDVGLPGKSGRFLPDRIKETWPDVRVILTSGYASDSPGNAGDLPADIPFLQKPFTSDALIEVVRASLDETGARNPDP